MLVATPSWAENETPSSASSAAAASVRPSVCSSPRHWRAVIATTITRRPSLVTKSRPKAPKMSLPWRGRSAPVISASASWPMLARLAAATSDSGMRTSRPPSPARRARSAETRAKAA